MPPELFPCKSIEYSEKIQYLCDGMSKLCNRILIIAFVAWMMAACNSHADRESLVAIDSLIMQNPDSAYSVLKSYPTDSLTSEDDHAYYALLTTIADYKTYRPATTDSVINIAVNHYDHDGANLDKRMRALLYKGCIMEELGESEIAIEYYKRAEKVCAPNDDFHIGYICLRKAILYQLAYSDSIPMENYRKAIVYFHNARAKHYESLCHNSIGMIYSRAGNYDLAVKELRQCIALARSINDTLNLCEGYNAMCHTYYGFDLYEKVIAASDTLFKISANVTLPRSSYDIVSISFSKMGCPDSATKYMEMAPKPVVVEDTISYLRSVAELALAKGDIKGYIQNNDRAVNKSDSLLLLGQVEKIRTAEAKYDLAMQEVENLSKQKRLILVISALSLLVAIVSSIVYFQRKRIAHIKIENEEARNQLSLLKRNLTETESESQKRIVALREQELQLQKMQEDIRLLELGNQEKINSTSIEKQLMQTRDMLQTAEVAIAIQTKTRFCLDEILRLSYYSGKYNSDQVIDNESTLELSQDFWKTIFEVVSLMHDNLFERIRQKGVTLTENEKKLLSLCAINIPSAIIRRVLKYKSIQIVSNQKRKLALKATSTSTRIEDIFSEKK